LTKTEFDPKKLSITQSRGIGERFRLLRKAAGITLKQFGDSVGMSVNTIRAHESGRCLFRTDDLIIAAKAIGCDPSMLLTVAPDGGTPKAEKDAK
jgi:transcriptional regulator with XRE-family HTH domain